MGEPLIVVTITVAPLVFGPLGFVGLTTAVPELLPLGAKERAEEDPAGVEEDPRAKEDAVGIISLPLRPVAVPPEDVATVAEDEGDRSLGSVWAGQP